MIRVATLSPPLRQIERTFVSFQGKKYSYFAGCDYYRLASHPNLISALAKGAHQNGLSVAASRKTTGNHVLYEQLEHKIATFFQVPGATLVSSGYAANLV